jgi:hypothetical protein
MKLGRRVEEQVVKNCAEEMTEREWPAKWSYVEAMTRAVTRAGERKNS